MIHVLCLNPAIDKLLTIDGFSAGEVYPGQTPKLAVGGKGVNVARVLSQLGEEASLYAFLGEDGGEPVRREMEARCACTFLSVPGACRTTTNIIDRRNGRETVISETGPTVAQKDVDTLLAQLTGKVSPGDLVCCSGSVIAGAPEDIYAQVSRICAARGARCVLDCNAKTLPASLEGAEYALGKPNESELASLLGREKTCDPAEIAAMARTLMPPYGQLLVSLGAQGGVLVSPRRALLARVPEAPVVSTVGSGDASLAGALCALARGYDMERMLRLAMACGVVNAMTDAVGSVDVRTVREMEARIDVGAV